MKQARNALLVLTLFVFVAMPAAQDRTPPRVPGIDVSGMDLSVRPQDDFFRYVNGRWADDTQIPADLSSYGTFAILRERSQEAIRAIIEGEARAQAAPGSNSQKVGERIPMSSPSIAGRKGRGGRSGASTSTVAP